jgi:hypothetical protein
VLSNGFRNVVLYKVQTNKRKPFELYIQHCNAIVITIRYSLPYCLMRFPYLHTCIQFIPSRCQCITNSARRFQYQRASVVCYITDVTLSRMTQAQVSSSTSRIKQCHSDSWAGNHLGSRILHWVLVERTKSSNIVCLYIPFDHPGKRGRRVQCVFQIGSDMWICIRYKQTKANEKPFQLYI